MRVFLQQPPSMGNPPRYLRLTLQVDLFAGWSLLRESGQNGRPKQLRREQFLTREEAIEAFKQLRDQYLKRGFQALSPDDIDATY